MKKFIFILCLCTISLSAQEIEKQLGQLYVQKNYSELYTKANDFLAKNSNHAGVNLIKGRALVDQGNFNEGRSLIEKAIQNDRNNSWIKAWGLNYLGKIEFVKGNKNKAIKCLRECISMNATKNVTNSSKRLLLLWGEDQFYKDWEKIETQNINFIFQPNSVVKNPNAFAKSRQKAFLAINSFFSSKLPKKIDFIVWNGNEDAKEIGIKQLGIAKPKFCVIHSRANQSRGHEITHVISHYYKEPKFVSTFINEGIATAFDHNNDNKLRRALLLKVESNFKDKISIKSAWIDPTKYPEWVYYPLAGEFITRLIDRGGKTKFLQFANNQSYENAEKIYGKMLSEIIEKLEREIN